jgi:2-iminobutanoate/2-iminopropanoate deaminase
MIRSMRFAFATIVSAAGCAQPAPPSATFVPMPGPTARPFSAAVITNGMIYLSGQIGIDNTGQLAAGGIAPETRQALENIRVLLAAHGASMRDVVKCTVMLADIREWGAMNDVYLTFFPTNPPARSAFGTSGLALGARVEIECVAAAPHT